MQVRHQKLGENRWVFCINQQQVQRVFTQGLENKLGLVECNASPLHTSSCFFVALQIQSILLVLFFVFSVFICLIMLRFIVSFIVFKKLCSFSLLLCVAIVPQLLIVRRYCFSLSCIVCCSLASHVECYYSSLLCTVVGPWLFIIMCCYVFLRYLFDLLLLPSSLLLYVALVSPCPCGLVLSIWYYPSPLLLYKRGK